MERGHNRLVPAAVMGGTIRRIMLIPLPPGYCSARPGNECTMGACSLPRWLPEGPLAMRIGGIGAWSRYKFLQSPLVAPAKMRFHQFSSEKRTWKPPRLGRTGPEPL